jgi:hypothetical protein
VLERVALRQLQQHLDAEPSLNPLQSAYRRDHSTETALAKITSDNLLEMDKQRHTVMALLDFLAAFDTIEHQTLIDRLSINFNITSTALDWFRSYLTQRLQPVCIGQSRSEPAVVTRGVPQGSVLGPVLYTMYTALLYHVIAQHNISSHFYADDTQLYVSCKSTELSRTVVQLEACITDMLRWLLPNNFSLNAAKFEVMLFGTRQQLTKIPEPTTVHIGDSFITAATSARNLGVWLDSTMSFDVQLANVCRSCYSHIRRLARIRRYLTIQSTSVLGAPIVASKLDYCNGPLGGITEQHWWTTKCAQLPSQNSVSVAMPCAHDANSGSSTLAA